MVKVEILKGKRVSAIDVSHDDVTVFYENGDIGYFSHSHTVEVV